MVKPHIMPVPGSSPDGALMVHHYWIIVSHSALIENNLQPSAWGIIFTLGIIARKHKITTLDNDSINFR